MHDVIDQVKKVQHEKDDYCLQRGLHLLKKQAEDLVKVVDCLDQSKEKYITLTDLTDVAFEHLLTFLPMKDQKMLRLVSPSMYDKVTINNSHFRCYKINLMRSNQIPVFPPFFHQSKLPVALKFPRLEKLDNADYMGGLCFLLGSLQNRFIGIDVHVDVIDRLKHYFNMSFLETIEITGYQPEPPTNGEPYCTAISFENCSIIGSMIMKSPNLRKLVIQRIIFPDDGAENLEEITGVVDKKEKKLPNLKEAEFDDCACKGGILARVMDEGSKSIKGLKVRGKDLSYFSKMQQPMESLEQLDIDSKKTAPNEHGVKTLLSLSLNVKHLKLYGLQLDKLGMTGQEYQHLKHFLMENCSSPSDHLQCLLVNISSTIEELVFDYCQMKIEGNCKYRFPQLKRLEMYDESGDLHGISRIIEMATKLEVFGTNQENLTDSIVRNLDNKKLTALILRGNDWIDKRDLNQLTMSGAALIANHANHLNRLELADLEIATILHGNKPLVNLEHMEVLIQFRESVEN